MTGAAQGDAATARSGLALEDVRISVAGRLMAAVDLSVRPGEVATLMGPSGTGKSTILAVITGTVDPAFEVSGRVCLDGADLAGLPPEDRRIGLMFQDDLLFPHLSVGGNLAFGLRPGGSRAQRRAAVAAALEEVGLDGFAGRDPATLSGGQRARVALMRVLLSEPRALLLDEPFSRLDADRRDRTRRMVFATAAARGLPVLMVTHDAEDAAAAGGRVVRLGGSDTA